MENLPIDLNHPAVRQYVALIRLQVLTPLSLLINIATLLVTSVLLNPTIQAVSAIYPTSISPNPHVISAYIIAILAGQLAYCILLVIAHKDETKKTLTQGVGLSLVFANWLMSFWAIAWVFKWFIAATIFQGILLLALVYANIVLLIYHPPTSKRPLDILFIHAPMRFFLVLEFALMFPLTLFVALGLVLPFGPGKEVEYDYRPWPGFGVVLGTNLLGALVVVLRRDIVWTVAAVWVCASIWSQRPKHSSIYITTIAFSAVHPVLLVTVYIHSYFYKRQPVALPADDHHPGLYRENAPAEQQVGPREVNADEVWA